MISDFEGFLYQNLILSITLFSYLNSWERASIFPFECSVLNKGTIGTILIKSLVWRGPWLGIEPGTSRARSQHYTTRPSRRRYPFYLLSHMFPGQTNWLLIIIVLRIIWIYLTFFFVWSNCVRNIRVLTWTNLCTIRHQAQASFIMIHISLIHPSFIKYLYDT